MILRPLQDRQRALAAAGLDRDAEAWPAAADGCGPSGDAAADALEPDAAALGEVCRRGWALLERLPPRSRRSEPERAAGDAIVETLADATGRFARAHRGAIYDRLTDGMARTLRADALVWEAAERWPGVFPTRAEVAREAERMLGDKDGREIAQGLLLGQVLGEPRAGTHLMLAMLRPKPEAEALLEALRAQGTLELDTVRVEVHGACGYVYFRYPRYLNAEDDETLADQETAVDLLLLHPQVRMGVLRGDPVTHPKYAGRRIFSAGLNLTRLYHGQLSYLFYVVRDLGLVNKLYRGHTRVDFRLDEPDDTEEMPWLAVVDGFAIGGGCQLLLVMDYVIAEQGAYFNLPARKEGIIPGCANLRLPRFVGEAVARQGILFDRTFAVEEPAAASIVHEVHPREGLDAAVLAAVDNALGAGMVSAGANRKALRVQTEPLERLRAYMALYAREQAFCHLSPQLSENLERHWRARERRL